MADYASLLAPISEPDLLVRPPPERSEGPLGYLLRLAEANCMTLHELSGLGVRYDLGCLTRQRLLPDVALDPDLHAHVARLDFLLETSGRIWNQRYARFCPQCLAEDSTWRASWELYFHDACPRHGVWLVDICSSCGESVRWSRESLLRCQCGSDLREELPGYAPDNVRRLSAVLEDKLLCRPEANALPPFVGLNVDQVQRLIRYLGGYMDPGSNPKPLKLRNAGRLEVSWPISSLAAEIVFDWPIALHRTLDCLQAASVDGKAGLKGVFKQAYSYLYKGFSESAFAPIRETFETWLAAHWKGGVARRNRRLSAELLEKVQWIPGNVAAETLGISMARLRFLIHEGTLEGQESFSTSGRRFTIVRRDPLDQIRAQLAGELTMSEAMELLGIGKVRMQRILRLLFPSARRINDLPYLPWCVPRREVDALLLLGSHVPVVCIPEEHQVSLGHLLKYWNWTGDEIVALIEATKAGTIALQAMLDNARGIGRWIFDVAQLRALQKGMNSGRSNWVSIPEMAKILGVKQQVAYWLTQHGFVRAERLGTLKGIGSRVRREELERFRQSHVFGRDVAAIIGTSSPKAMRMLAEQGIYPLRAHGCQASRQLIYAHSEELQHFLAQVTGSSPVSFKLVSCLGLSDAS
ncbi:TniQ family protein [uncultured Azonexus sp.]|uniref:TniQ family protein n=1 Tax=uncultured Azonexus sp. TaxID=520307 RepID=UPI00260B1573|nr:TniQ family protein [uncultured Azonexus sp.]